MNKEHIIDEIKRTAAENNEAPLGQARFEKETGIKVSDWYGRYWARWSDAVTEAGFAPNKFNQAYDEEFVIKKLINLIQELGKYPTAGELRLKASQDKTYPAHTVFERLGKKNDKIKKLIVYCGDKPELSDVLEICQPLYRTNEEVKEEEMGAERENYGFVYLIKSDKHYKIGRSICAEMRHHQLKIQLPEEAHLVHKIKTDDPSGIEAYWHKRFEQNRKNGEWFELSSTDVKAFKRRKFM